MFGPMTDEALSWNSIIDALGGTSEVAGALSQLPSVVSGWRERGIPAPHWAGVVRLAADKGRDDVSLEVLAELAARKLAGADMSEVRA
jgi:hypothetical protein